MADDDQEAPGMADDNDQEEWGRQITGPSATPETILTLFEQEGHRFEARNLAVTAYRVGKIGGPRVRSDRRLPPLAQRCRQRIDAFEPPDLAATAWGFVKTGFIERLLFAVIAAAAVTSIGNFGSQGMAMTVWAFATARVAAPTLFTAVAEQALGRIDEFNPHSMATTTWAFATAGVAAETLFNAIAAVALMRLGDFNPQNLANTV